MPLEIPANQIKNLQQMEVVVSGPDEANRLIIIISVFWIDPMAWLETACLLLSTNLP
jgi:hypothetical protein